ncbi:MAG: hypothetical protein M1839_001006 [Geoglossum umbratile]|nr:MAG: hypothetical protein M1839_001006 [Geoglossum umbratile]
MSMLREETKSPHYRQLRIRATTKPSGGYSIAGLTSTPREESTIPLQLASMRGHIQIIQRLLEGRADVNIQGGYFGNALQAASLNGRDQVVQLLLKWGANAKAQGGYYGNALQAASHWGRLLWQRAASHWGHDQVVQQLLERGADVNAQGGYHGSALQAASMEGHHLVKRLLDRGADANAQGGHSGNALQEASRNGHDQVAQLLLESGANAKDQRRYLGSGLQVQEPAQLGADTAQPTARTAVSPELMCHASLSYASLSDLAQLSPAQLASLDDSLRRLVLYVQYADWDALCRTDQFDRDFREALTLVGIRWSEGLVQPRLTAGEIRHYMAHGGSWYVPHVYPERINVLNASIGLCLWRGVALE